MSRARHSAAPACGRATHAVRYAAASTLDRLSRHEPRTARVIPARTLADGPVICAEGYVFELERRGYLQAGAFVPEVVLEHPGGRDAAAPRLRARRLRRRRGAHVLRAPREAARHRPRGATSSRSTARRSRSRRTVADETGTLLAGDICNTNVYDPADPASHRAVRAMFEEQVGWAVDAGVDFVIGETFSWAQEALIAARRRSSGRGCRR